MKKCPPLIDKADKFQNLSAEKNHLVLTGYRSSWTWCTNANGQCFLQSSWPHLQAETLSTKALISIFLIPDLLMFTFWLFLWMLGTQSKQGDSAPTSPVTGTWGHW